MKNLKKRSLFALAPVAAGCAVLLVSTGSVYAQSANLGTVTVTGIRKGIEDAISVKKNSDSIVEAISAEDIGKLPDSSVAESIARLPGVTAQRNRDSGRAQDVSIRGMPSSFGTALLNGREQATTSFGRGVEFDQYPSELMSGVTVYKTPDARLSGQGLSGTIDLQTVSPLNFSTRQVAAGIRTEKTGVGLESQGTGTRTNFSYIDQFADRTIGLALGFARLDNTSGEQYSFDGGWGGGDAKIGLNGSGGTIKADYNGYNEFTDTTKQKRDGFAAILEFKPNKDFTSKLDMLGSRFVTDVKRVGFGGPLNDDWGDRSPYDRAGYLTNVTPGDGGRVAAGTWNEVRAFARNDPVKVNDELSSIGWANKFKIAEGLTGFADIGQSTAKHDYNKTETNATTCTQVNATTCAQIASTGATGLPTLSFTNYGKNVTGTSINFSDPNIIKLTDPQGWNGDQPQVGYVNNPVVDETVKTARLGARWDLGDGFFSALDFGLNLTDRKKTKVNNEAVLSAKGTGVKGTPGYNAFAFANVPNPSVGYAGASKLPVIVWDPIADGASVLDRYTVNRGDQQQKSYGIAEKITAYYGKLDIDSTLAGIPVRGNVGVQVVNTDQSSTAAAVDTSSGGLVNVSGDVTLGKTYTDVLPVMNLVFDAGSGQNVRFSMGQQMARPDMEQMRAVRTISYDATKQRYTGSGGNPKLDPYRADAFDLAYEKFFGTQAYFGAAVFYKDVKSYVLDATDKNYDFSSEVNALIARGSKIVNAPSKIGDLSSTINGSGGTIQGVELTANLPLSLISSVFDGFGVVATASSTTSSLAVPNKAGGSNASMELPGLSKMVSSITAYYEKDGYSVRIANRQRSPFVGSYLNVYARPAATYIGQESITDLQLGYEFKSGALKGLSVLVQANNLTNAEFRQYEIRDGKEVDTGNFSYGKTILFGLSYKL